MSHLLTNESFNFGTSPGAYTWCEPSIKFPSVNGLEEWPKRKSQA